MVASAFEDMICYFCLSAPANRTSASAPLSRTDVAQHIVGIVIRDVFKTGGGVFPQEEAQPLSSSTLLNDYGADHAVPIMVRATKIIRARMGSHKKYILLIARLQDHLRVISVEHAGDFQAQPRQKIRAP